jgi:hypothetical protein
VFIYCVHGAYYRASFVMCQEIFLAHDKIIFKIL